MNRRLGCMTGGGLLAAALTIAIVLVFYVARGGAMFSPGPLNAQPGEEALGGVTAHAEIGGQCAACHTAPWSSATLADRCQACHASVANELVSNQGLHAQLRGQAGAFDCRGCHSEHKGPTAALTQIDPAAFPHAATGYDLAGHRQMTGERPFACGDCHTTGVTQFALATCQDCHRQMDAAYMTAHVADFGEACLGCHDGVDRYSRKRFDHNALSFALDGEHTDLACSKCHAGAASPGDLQATKSGCVDCHRADDAHKGQFGTDCAGCHNTAAWPDATFDHAKTAFPLTGKHEGVKCQDCHRDGRFKGTSAQCVDCHRADDAHKGQFGTDSAGCHNTSAWPDATFDHAKTAFPLTGKHEGAKCQDCHRDGQFKGTSSQCVDCHRADDAHKGQFGTDCAGCHNTSAWPNATFDHAKTAFPLTGKHQGVKCQDCHRDGRFKGTSSQCVDCHRADDAHKGQFGTDCAGCHNTAAWPGATFDHAKTAFPLTGKHQGVKCQDCHRDGQFKGTPQQCAACHEDPVFHRGAFGTQCQDCHTTARWQPATFNQRHTFPIDHGEGGASSCRTCHPDAVKAYTCYGCHEHTPAETIARHAEEVQGDITDCVRCHPTGQEEGEGHGGGGD